MTKQAIHPGVTEAVALLALMEGVAEFILSTDGRASQRTGGSRRTLNWVASLARRLRGGGGSERHDPLPAEREAVVAEPAGRALASDEALVWLAT